MLAKCGMLYTLYTCFLPDMIFICESVSLLHRCRREDSETPEWERISDAGESPVAHTFSTVPVIFPGWED